MSRSSRKRDAADWATIRAGVVVALESKLGDVQNVNKDVTVDELADRIADEIFARFVMFPR